MKTFLIPMFGWAAFSMIAAAQAQTSPAPSQPQTPVFQAGSEEVMLDVVVRDKKGRIVRDLKSEDITVTDNGERRSIKSFRLVEGGESVSSSGARAQLDPMRQIRLITLIFQGLSPDGRRLAKDASMSLIKSELPQNVYVAVMAIDHKLEAIQSFTNDRELLRKAIDRATSGANDFTNDSIQVRTQLEDMLGSNRGGGQSLEDRAAALGSSATGPAAASLGAANANAALANLMVQILRSDQEDTGTDWGRATIFALLTAVKEQYRLPGRKTVLYFSEGFRIPQGMEEPFHSVIAIANRSNVSFYPIIASGLHSDSSNKGATDELAGAAAGSKSNATSTTGVSIDMARSVDRTLESGRADVRVALADLASSTGGSLIADTNDFKAPIRRLTEDVETYYEITYNPEIPKYDGSFRKVSVKSDRADLRIQSRAGYFALPPSMTNAGQVLAAYEVPLLKALDDKPLQHSFNFQSAGLHFRGIGATPTCEIVIAVPLADMTLQENKAAGVHEGKLAYVAVIKDDQGQVVKKYRNEIPLRITADKLDAYRASYFRYNESFDLAPGRYTLETAVMDVTGEKISARKSVVMIPAQAGSLGISSIAVINSMKAKDQTTKPNDPMVMLDKVVMPTVGPTVKKSEAETLPFFVVIYPDKSSAEKPALRMEFSRDGQPIGAGSPPLGDPDAQGRIQYVASAPVAKLEPGNYEVRFVATQGKEAAQETVTFTLQP